MLPALDPATQTASRDIGEKLRVARLSRGLSQEALAKRIGMTRTSYARLEKGQTNITIDSLVRIAQGLDLCLDIRLVEAQHSPSPTP